MDGSRLLVLSTTQLWHTDAVRGPSTPSSPAMTSSLHELHSFIVGQTLSVPFGTEVATKPLCTPSDISILHRHDGAAPLTRKQRASTVRRSRVADTSRSDTAFPWAGD